MRKASNLMLSSKNLKTFEHVEHAEATQMIMDLIRDPEASHQQPYYLRPPSSL